jgi:hypothetical protein
MLGRASLTPCIYTYIYTYTFKYTYTHTYIFTFAFAYSYIIGKSKIDAGQCESQVGVGSAVDAATLSKPLAKAGVCSISIIYLYIFF